MIKTSRAAALSVALAALGAPVAGTAQIAPAQGAPISGLCVYSNDVMLGRSQAGVSADQQLAQLQSNVVAELKPVKEQLSADERDFDARSASLPVAQARQQAADLQRRARQLDELARTRNDQLLRTRNDVAARISAAAVPSFNAAVANHRCAAVIERKSLYTANPAMDFTGEVIEGVNRAMPAITVQLAAPSAGR
jgi:Skp family chaperone for outer membrane proteins